MRRLSLRILLILATLCFIGEEISRTLGGQSEDLFEFSSGKEAKKETAEAGKDDYFEPFGPRFILNTVERKARTAIVLRGVPIPLSGYLDIFLPPPEGRLA
jgi:hypothetical protein